MRDHVSLCVGFGVNVNVVVAHKRKNLARTENADDPPARFDRYGPLRLLRPLRPSQPLQLSVDAPCFCATLFLRQGGLRKLPVRRWCR